MSRREPMPTWGKVSLLLLGVIAVAFAVSTLAGCTSTTVDRLHAQQSREFVGVVVEGVLLPHYLADEEVSEVSKQNVEAAVREHREAIEDWSTP